MMKACMVIGLLMSILAMPLVDVEAGTFIVGAKYWYARWDSAVLDWFEKDIGVGFKTLGATLDSDVGKGTGHLAGPLLGYQTDDGTWSFSFAPMVISQFSQDWHGTAGTMNLSTDIDTTRRDYDLAATYSLSQYKEKLSFLEYCSIYMGFKYQTVEYDLNLKYNTEMGDVSYDYKLDAQVSMPTVGVGIAYPVFDKVVLGLQGGVGLALIRLKMKDPDNVSFDIDPQYSYMFNTEGNVSILPVNNMIIQLGLRYQEWYLKARSPQRWEKTESKDSTFGPTFTVVYTF
jgi:hypothetical protein